MTTALGHERNDTIDVFRAIAILGVMLYHYTIRLTSVPLSPWVPVFELGRFGVQVFFIISGIVIAMTLTRSSSVMDFAIKRFARIYPAYIVAVLITFTVTRIVVIPDFWLSVRQLIQNVVPYDFGQKQVDPSYWSLTCEIQFYILAAILFGVLKERFWIALTVITVGGAALVITRPDLAQTFQLALYLPFFLAGVGTWKVRYDNRQAGWYAIVIALACYCLTSGHIETRSHQYAPWMMHCYILGLGALLILLIVRKTKLEWAVLPLIGRVSYSLYLIHQVIGLSIIRVLYDRHVPAMAAMGVASAVVIASAFAMFHLVEEPGRRAMLALIARASANRDRPAHSA